MIIPLNDHVGQFGVVPAVPGPDDAAQLHVLAELDLAAGLHPRREQLRPRQLPEQPDLGLELVAASAEDGRRLLLHPGSITQSVKYFIPCINLENIFPAIEKIFLFFVPIQTTKEKLWFLSVDR